MITPDKQPVAAEKGWVDVRFLACGLIGELPICDTCSIRITGTVNDTVSGIMAGGIWDEAGRVYITPSAVICIRVRK